MTTITTTIAAIAIGAIALFSWNSINKGKKPSIFKITGTIFGNCSKPERRARAESVHARFLTLGHGCSSASARDDVVDPEQHAGALGRRGYDLLLDAHRLYHV